MKALILLLSVLAAACSGGSSGSAAPSRPAAVNLDGTWTGAWREATTGLERTLGLNLRQRQGAAFVELDGVFALPPFPCSWLSGTGTVAGDTLTMEIVVDGGGRTMVLAELVAGGELHGSHATVGGPCNGQSGTMELVRP